MRVHHLNCGTMTPPVIGRIVCHVLLCELPDRLVLVDTGFGTADIADPARRLGAGRHLLRARLDPEETALRQVEALGFAREDVRDVVLTHFDLDHVGGLADFPHATVHVLADEWAAATRPTARERQRYRPVQWAHEPRIATYPADGEPWEGLPAARALDGLAGEVVLIPLPGHTRGHGVVAVRSDDAGWLVHAGDAYFHRGAIGDRDGRRSRAGVGLTAFEAVMAADPRRLGRNHEILTGLRGRYPVFCAHDPEELERFLRVKPGPAAP